MSIQALDEPSWPEPHFGFATGTHDFIQHSHDPMAELARKRINSWYQKWKVKPDKELLGRLHSEDETHFLAAVWELCVNAMLIQMGASVERITQPNSGKIPDFLVTARGFSFYVEATMIEDSAGTTEEKHWKRIIQAFEMIDDAEHHITIRPERMSAAAPSINALMAQTRSFLSKLNPNAHQGEDLWEEGMISDDNWTINVLAFPKGNDGRRNRTLAGVGSGRSAQITDDLDLKRKIQRKRKRYKNLDHPLVLAILENSFVASNDNWHRMNALYGAMAMQISQDGTTVDIRLPGGLWDLEHGETNVSALILQDRLWLSLQDLTIPTLWLNPNLSSTGPLREAIPIGRYEVQGDEVQFQPGAFMWNEDL